MALADLTSPSAVLQAVSEFDALGRDSFLEKYGFARSRSYFLTISGHLYDSKAIVGAAHGFARPDLGPLAAADFSGGERTVARRLRELGFTVKNTVIEGLEGLSAEDVSAALDEFDLLGQQAFLEKYGLRASSRYFIARGGKHYDAKAILSVSAARLLGGTPLEPGELRGSEDTVAKPLAQLGFDVVESGPEPFELEVGRHYERKRIHDAFSGQRYGGIITPAAFPLVIVITGKEGGEFGYHDKWTEEGGLDYFGEGQVGNMTLTKGNAALRDHAGVGKELHVFEKIRDKWLRYRGQFDCAGYRWQEGVPDKNGAPRKALIFQLVPHSPLLALEDGEADAEDELANLSLAELRALAAEKASETSSYTESRSRVYKRSAAVKRYVLARSGGECEGCGFPAPFARADGTPYLEPHHVRRRSDGGPDDPAWVIALCPNCHRRTHYGGDGAEYNNALIGKLPSLEASVLPIALPD